MRVAVLLTVLALASTADLGDTQNNITASTPVVTLGEVQDRGLKFNDEENWRHSNPHPKHPMCRSHIANADIAKTRHLVQRCGFPKDASCPCEHPPYRQFSGACNNPRKPGLGTATSPYNRVLRARYADGVGKVVRRTSSERIPKARVISYTIYKDRNRKDHQYSLMLMQWGQLITHDVGMRVNIDDESGAPISCCDFAGGMDSREDGIKAVARDNVDGENWKENPACMPIRITSNDPLYSEFPFKCIDFVRSQFKVCSPKDGEADGARWLAASGSGSSEEAEVRSEEISRKGRHLPTFKSRSQLNMVTSFLDLSIVYGNSRTENQKLRVGKGGLLRSREVQPKEKRRSCEEDSSEEVDTQEFLPLATSEKLGCDPTKKICYEAGDIRVNTHPWLTSMQTIMMREHNRLARRLRKLHPEWNDEKLFQEARRILIAEWQLITYRDFLPKIVGKKILKRMDMLVSPDRRSKYSSRVNPSSLNEFSQGAFRFLHSMIDGTIELMGNGQCPLKKLRLGEQFNNPSVLEPGHNFEALVRGLSNQPSQQADRFVTKEMTTGFIEQVSDDIQRGRDHGLPSYNDMRDICGLRKADDFDDLRDVMKEKSIKMLKSLYRSVNDVDLYVGGTLEEHCVDGDHAVLTGPTFGCIIAEQFYRLRRGDRYFYDHEKGPGAFTEGQYQALNEVTLASILCENLGDEKWMQPDPFMRVSRKNKLKRCKDIPKLNMKPWKNYYRPVSCRKSHGI